MSIIITGSLADLLVPNIGTITGSFRFLRGEFGTPQFVPPFLRKIGELFPLLPAVDAAMILPFAQSAVFSAEGLFTGAANSNEAFQQSPQISNLFDTEISPDIVLYQVVVRSEIPSTGIPKFSTFSIPSPVPLDVPELQSFVIDVIQPFQGQPPTPPGASGDVPVSVEIVGINFMVRTL